MWLPKNQLEQHRDKHLQHQLLIAFLEQLEQRPVITSYSIHYTKLYEDVAGSITHSLLRSGEKSVHFRVEPIADCPIDETTMAIHLAFGGVVGSYTFDKYFTKREDDITLNKISVQTENYEEAEIRYKSYAAIASYNFV